MKNSPLTTFLLVLGAAGALFALVLCWSFTNNARELRDLQAQVATVNNNRTLINALATEAVEYSKKNRDIIPLLESVGLKQAAAPGATTAPKPATNGK